MGAPTMSAWLTITFIDDVTSSHRVHSSKCGTPPSATTKRWPSFLSMERLLSTITYETFTSFDRSTIGLANPTGKPFDTTTSSTALMVGILLAVQGDSYPRRLRRQWP